MNGFIAEAMERKISVRVITINGYQMCGTIVDEGDSFIVVRTSRDKKMVYKHAISTIETA